MKTIFAMLVDGEIKCACRGADTAGGICNGYNAAAGQTVCTIEAVSLVESVEEWRELERPTVH